MTDERDVSIGLDLGTSGVKVVALTADGRVLGRARAASVTARPEADAAEQDPAAWLASCDEALRALATLVDPARWAAIGLSAMLPTLVTLDEHLAPIGPAVTWEDGRAEPDARRIAASVGAAEIYRRTGQRLDGRYLLPMHARRARLREHAGAWAVGAKDYLFHVFTGHLLTDPSTAAGYGAYDLRAGSWDPEILAAAGAPRVPDIAGSDHAAPLGEECAARWGCAAGIPVVLGGADSVLGAYGLDIRRPGTIAYIAGTSSVILGWSDTAQIDPDGRYLVTPMVDGGFGLEMDLMTTGSAVAWLAALFGMPGGAAELAELAQEGALERAPIVLPYLAPGEQGALWDPHLVGAVDGLTLHTTRADLARGLLAGIVAESRRCAAALHEAAGGHRGAIAVSGSGATSAVFRRDLADATGREVHYDPEEHDHSAVGAAVYAGRSALGWQEETDMAADRVEITVPDPDGGAAWTQRYAQHERLRLAQNAARAAR